MKKIVFLTTSDAEFGFGLAGMSQYTGEPEKGNDILKELLTEPDTGLVIIDERMIKGMDEDKMREMEKRWHGILLVLPSPVKPEAGVEDYASRLIRRAIGYHVRLKL